MTLRSGPALACLVFLSAAAAQQPNTLTGEERREGYILLFDGRTLNGWEGDRKLWSVRDGAIVGSTEGQPLKDPVHIYHTREFTDFILKADIKLRNGNSGIQFRSGTLPGFRLMGYQADACDEGQQKNGPSWGNFYEQYGRGRGIMKDPFEGWNKAKAVVRPRDWNTYEILANRKKIQIKLNGAVTIDTTDDRASTGLVGIQLHQGEPMEVRVRNVKVKPLAAK
jgi:hypothetical protein